MSVCSNFIGWSGRNNHFVALNIFHVELYFVERGKYFRDAETNIAQRKDIVIVRACL